MVVLDVEVLLVNLVGLVHKGTSVQWEDLASQVVKEKGVNQELMDIP